MPLPRPRIDPARRGAWSAETTHAPRVPDVAVAAHRRAQPISKTFSREVTSARARFISNIHAKLCEINASVSGRGQKPDGVGAGDQGRMFGYLAAAAGLVCYRASASWPASWRACVCMDLAPH